MSDQLEIINATGCTVRQADAFLAWHLARLHPIGAACSGSSPNMSLLLLEQIARVIRANVGGAMMMLDVQSDKAASEIIALLQGSEGLGASCTESGGSQPAAVKSDGICKSDWEQRLTAQTCGFAQHIDREGEGWSKFRHSDVCAALGEVERLRRGSATARSTTFWRDDALTKSAEIVRHWFGADGEGCATDIEALLSSGAPPISRPEGAAGNLPPYEPKALSTPVGEGGGDMASGADIAAAGPSACAATAIHRKSDGERLCEAFAETFDGGGWADAPAWDDFDAAQQDRWNRTARIFLLDIAAQTEGGAS